MKREFLLVTARGRTAWIILILALFALPPSAAFAARSGIHDAEHTASLELIEEEQQIPDWMKPTDDKFAENIPVIYNPHLGAFEQAKTEKPKTPLSHNSEFKERSSNWPFSTTVKIIASWPSDSITECSGVLVADNTLLTAGHCVFTHTADFCGGEETSCWAEDLEIILYQGAEERRTGYTQILTWTAWTQNRNFEYDLAGVRLNQSFGNTAGWLGFGNNVKDEIFSQEVWKHTSVPVGAENPPITSKLFQFTKILGEDLFYSDNLSDYGQSGAGAYNSDNDYKHIVYSILSHHRKLGDDVCTGYTRITDVKFFALRDWINGNMQEPSINIFLPIFAN